MSKINIGILGAGTLLLSACASNQQLRQQISYMSPDQQIMACQAAIFNAQQQCKALDQPQTAGFAAIFGFMCGRARAKVNAYCY